MGVEGFPHQEHFAQSLKPETKSHKPTPALDRHGRQENDKTYHSTIDYITFLIGKSGHCGNDDFGNLVVLS